MDHHMLSNQDNDMLEEEASIADSRSGAGTLFEALNEYQNQENARHFRALLRRVLSGGHPIDMKMNNDQTLLHHAVSLDLVKEVITILNCGAILMENKYGKTPLDIALERGNQILLQILNRSGEYQNYIKAKFNDASLPNVRLISNRKSDSMADTIFGQHKYGWSQYELDKVTNKLVQTNSHTRSVVYDDYLDWTDSQRATYQQHFLDILNKAEKSYHVDLGNFSERKNMAVQRLQNMDPSLRDREHRYCMQIWATVVGERDSRRYLEQISTTSEHLKKALELSYQHVYYVGQGSMRYYNGFVMKLWKQVYIRLTGSTLRLGHENSAPEYNSSAKDPTGDLSHTAARRKSSVSANPAMDCMDDTQGQAKSRTIMIDNIRSVEVSLKLPMFPRVQQALNTRRASASTVESTSSSHDPAKKVFFIFYFKSSTSESDPTSTSTSEYRYSDYESSSPFLKKQREKSQTPPKHPIVLSLNATTSPCEGGGDTVGPVAFYNAIKASMPDVEIAGSSCLVTTDSSQESLDSHNPEDRDSSFYNFHNSLNSPFASSPCSPPSHVGRSSESQVYGRSHNQSPRYSHDSASPSEWSQFLGSSSGRTSVESLMTANSSSGDSHSLRTRSSHGSNSSSSYRRSTLSSLDEAVSDHDQHQLEAVESRKRPCALGVIEERESRYSNDSHSSHHSRTNSNSLSHNTTTSLLSTGGGKFAFSNEVLADHSRYLLEESERITEEASRTELDTHAGEGTSIFPTSSSTSLHNHSQSRESEDSLVSSTLPGKTSPKRVIEKNGILSCENSSSVGEEERSGVGGGLATVEWASVESDKCDEDDALADTSATDRKDSSEHNKKDYNEFADTIGGTSTHHQAKDCFPLERSRSRSRTLSVEVLNDENVVSSSPLSFRPHDSKEDRKKERVNQDDKAPPCTPPLSRRSSLLAISLQNSPPPPPPTKPVSPLIDEPSVASILDTKLCSLQDGQMSKSEPFLSNSEAMNRMLSSPAVTPTTSSGKPDPEHGGCEGPSRPMRSTPISIAINNNNHSVGGSQPPRHTQSHSYNAIPVPFHRTQPLSSSFSSDHNILGRDSDSSSVLDMTSFYSDRLSLSSLPPTPPPSGDKSVLEPSRSMSMSMSADTRPPFHMHQTPRPSRPPLALNKAQSVDHHHSSRYSGRHSFATPSSDHYSSHQSRAISSTSKKNILHHASSSLFNGTRPVSKLRRVLAKVRNNRDNIQARLVKYITEREAFLEILHYLQSLRTLVKNPPTTPLLYKPNSTPDSVLTQIKRINRKAFSLLTLTRHSEDCHHEVRKLSRDDNKINSSMSRGRTRCMSSLSDVEEECFYNQEHGSAKVNSAHLLEVERELEMEMDFDQDETQFSVEEEEKMSSIHDLEGTRERDRETADLLLMKNSYEAETFVNKMLDSSTSYIVTTQEANMMENSFQSNDSGRFISFDNDVIDGQAYLSPSSSMIDSSSTMSRGIHHRHGDAMDISNTHTHPHTHPSAPVTRSSNTSDDIASYFRENSNENLEREDRGRMNGVVDRHSSCSTGGGAGVRNGSGISSLAQLGAPPREVLDIHAIIRKDLEEVWQCDLLIYETVEKLAHCLLLREQTWSQIHKMQNQEKTVETPDIDDLYDIEI